MNELVKLVAQKTGMSEDMARTAVNVVLGFLKTKLPAPFNTQLEGIVNGDVNADDLLPKGAGGFLKGLFGKK